MKNDIQTFMRAVGFGAGFTAVALVAVGFVAWFATRSPAVGPWNRDAIAAKYADLYLTAGQSLIIEFRYTVSNHTDHDYELPGADKLYRVLTNGKGLQRDESFKWDGGTFVPSGQSINIGIRVEYEYTEDKADTVEKLAAFTERRLSEMEGFAALDQLNRYEIRFPKPPEVK